MNVTVVIVNKGVTLVQMLPEVEEQHIESISQLLKEISDNTERSIKSILMEDGD